MYFQQSQTPVYWSAYLLAEQKGNKKKHNRLLFITKIYNGEYLFRLNYRQLFRAVYITLQFHFNFKYNIDRLAEVVRYYLLPWFGIHF